MAEDMNNNDNEQSEGMPDDLRRLLARAEQGEDGGPDSYNLWRRGPRYRCR